MNHVVIFLMFFIISMTTSASNLPDWFKPRAKEVVVDTFIETMQKYNEYYKIKEITVTEGNLSSGQAALFIDVKFKDSKICENRRFSGQCTPLNDGKIDYVFCFEALTDCEPKPQVLKSKTYRR